MSSDIYYAYTDILCGTLCNIGVDLNRLPFAVKEAILQQRNAAVDKNSYKLDLAQFMSEAEIERLERKQKRTQKKRQTEKNFIVFSNATLRNKHVKTFLFFVS